MLYYLKAFIYFILYLLFKGLDKIKLKDTKIVINKKIKLLIFILILIPTLIYLIVYYPGVYLNDTSFIIHYPISMSNIHPLFYGLVMSIIFFSLNIVFTPSVSIFIMSIIQVLISSLIITTFIIWFNEKAKSKLLLILLVLYYVFTPIISNYNMALNKDTPYTLMIMLFFILIYEFIEKKGKVILEKKYYTKLLLVSIVIIYLRSNGIYIIIPTLIILFIIYGLKKHIIRYTSIIVLILIASFIQVIVLKELGVTYLKREKYSVPIQQICYLVKYHPDRLNKKDYELLSKIIPNTKEEIDNNYDEYRVDEIKYSVHFNNNNFNKNEKKFVGMWFNRLPSNIESYTKSYFLNTYHLWAVNKLDKKQSVFDEASIYLVNKKDRIYNKTILPNGIQNIFEEYYKLFNTYLNPAGCFILILIVNAYALYRKRKEVVLLSLPLLITWLVLMISSPLSSALRYMALYIYLLPVLILYTLKITRKDVGNE